MEPGEGRSYRLTLTLPDSGPAGPRQRGPGLVGDDRLGVGDRVPRARPRTPTPTPTAPPARDPAPPGPAPRPSPASPRRSRRCPCARRAAAASCASRTSACSARAGSRCTAAATARAGSRSARGSRPRRWRAPPARTLLRRRVFRALGARAAAAEHGRRPSGGSALRLTPRAVRTLKRTMHHRGRVAVVIVARVRGSRRDADRHPPDRAQARGRAPPPRAGDCRASRGSARRR